MLESLHQLGSYTESRKSIILTPVLPRGNMPRYLPLSTGISVGSAQPVTSASQPPTSSPAGSMQAALPASRLSSRGAPAGQKHRPGGGDTRSWLPPPWVSRAGSTERRHLRCRVEGNRDRVAITSRIHLADGGAGGGLSLWCCRTDVLQAQKPRAPGLGAEAGLWAYSPPRHHGEPCSLSGRKVGHRW